MVGYPATVGVGVGDLSLAQGSTSLCRQREMLPEIEPQLAPSPWRGGDIMPEGKTASHTWFLLKGKPEGLGESACSCAGSTLGMRLDWSPTSIYTHRWGDSRGTPCASTPGSHWKDVSALLHWLLAAFGPWGRRGAAMAPQNPGQRVAKLGTACKSLWRGRGHAGYEALPAQEHPCTVKGKRIFEVGSPARVGSCNRVFWHHLVEGGGVVQSPLEFLFCLIHHLSN